MGQAGGNEWEPVKKKRKYAAPRDIPKELVAEEDSRPRFEASRPEQQLGKTKEL